MENRKKSRITFASVLAAGAMVPVAVQAEEDGEVSQEIQLTGDGYQTEIADTQAQERVDPFPLDLGNFETGKLLVQNDEIILNLDEGTSIEDGIVFYGSYVAIQGAGFADHKVTLRPDNPGTVVDLQGTEVGQLKVDSGNVEEIHGAENVQDIQFTSGTSSEDVEITDSKGEAISVPEEDNQEEGSSDEESELTIMHTNDTHASLDNVAKRTTAINEVRAENPDALLLDAGDVFSGTLYFNEFQGMADLHFMNMQGYDAMTLGNHEFDLGSVEQGHPELAEFIENADFPFVSSNVDFSQDESLNGYMNETISSSSEDGQIYEGIVLESGGEEVGVFGLTTEDTAAVSSPNDVTFEDYLEEAEKAVDAFESQGVDQIIALTHIGYDDNAEIDNDLTLAEEVEGIDVIVGGHTHTTLAEPVVVDEDNIPTVIVQTGANNDNLGVLDVTFNEDGEITDHRGQLLPIAEYEDDPETADVLEDYQADVNELAEQQVGATAESELSNPRTGDGDPISVRNSETPLGNLITDGMLNKAQEYDEEVVMAFQNGGGIRAPIEAGPITVGEVITVLPFGNTLALMELTGEEIYEAFEISVGQYPAESGGFLHLSGGRVAFDSTQPEGERVVSVQVENEDGSYTEVQPNETYKIATNAFTAQGGDGYTVFEEAYNDGRVLDLGLSDWENLAEHLQGIGAIVPETEDRIVNMVEESTESSNS